MFFFNYLFKLCKHDDHTGCAAKVAADRIRAIADSVSITPKLQTKRKLSIFQIMEKYFGLYTWKSPK